LVHFKRVPHTRRAVMPGVHQFVARHLSGGTTMPLLQHDGQTFGDSSEIVRALELLQPEPPLYPADPHLRRRALELEQQFDTILAPAMRKVLYQEALFRREFAADVLSVGGPPLRRTLTARMLPLMAPIMRRTFDVPDRDDPGPRDTVRDQVAQIGQLAAATGFLVGDSFTVADLAACSFLIPFVDTAAMSAEMPSLPEPLAVFGHEIAATPGGEWVAAIWSEWRRAPRGQLG